MKTDNDYQNNNQQQVDIPVNSTEVQTWWEHLTIHEFWEICVIQDPNSAEFDDDYHKML